MPADPSYVELNDNTSAGAKVATFEYTDAESNVVQLQGVALVHPDGTAVSDRAPVSVASNLERYADIFDNLVTGARDNQIEVHFDDASWATYVTNTQTGGATNPPAQSNGHVLFDTGTGTNGSTKAVALDTVFYRPMHEVYIGFTASWLTAGLANSHQRIGVKDAADQNGFWIGYEGATLQLTHRRAGGDTAIIRSAWLDPIDGSAGSAFTRGGAPEAWDPTKANVFRVRFGLLGSAPLVIEVISPDGVWITIYRVSRPNLDVNPTFSNFDLQAFVDVAKSGAGATNLGIYTACWAGGTTSTRGRLSDAISDRSLAQVTRAIIEGKSPSGSYVKLSVNNAGRLQVTNDSVGATGAAVPAQATLVAGSDGTNLVPMKTDAAGVQRVSTTVEEKRLYDVASATVTYTGFAPRGTATSSAVWRIRKSTFDVLGNPLSELWATAVTWDGRAAASYT
ncbi:MAG: hypothetical protein EPN91_00865 [Salinibacterium sp.]|nr:MAG: hypothetical protein EPN91_00865 [Salinibacterium sp.]